MPSKKLKFQFDTEFQQTLLSFTVQDKQGYKALKLYNDSYFTLLEHQIISKALKAFYKEKKKLPKSNLIFKEYLRQLFNSREFSSLILPEDRTNVAKLVDTIYSTPVKDGDEILLSASKFKSYVSLKHTLEEVNLTDFNSYSTFAEKIRQAITIESLHKVNRGTFLITDIRTRQTDRHLKDNTFPTPFYQLNQSTNAGGYDRQSVIVIVGPEKFFKTGLLVNMARGYLKMRKKVLYIDLENGQDTIALRFEQSIMKLTKREILYGDNDEKVQRHFRKLNRIGAEVDIKRMPAYSTTCTTIQEYIDDQYREFGIQYDLIICDYAALLGAISGAKDETARISDAYVDFKNLVAFNNYEIGLTANHITREAKKRISSKYHTNDTAKCIDINRHVDGMVGINYTDEEKAAGVIRLEVIQQRDGLSEHPCYFWVDISKQWCKEFTKDEVVNYKKELSKNSLGENNDI